MTSSKFQHTDIQAVKGQAQIARYILREFSHSDWPTPRKMLDSWVQCFGHSNWQYFLRQTKGHITSTKPQELITKNNFILFSEKLHNSLSVYSLEQIRWSLASLATMTKADCDLIKRLLIKSVSIPLTPQIRNLEHCGFVEIETKIATNSHEILIVGYKPTEYGKYVAAHSLEKIKGHPLSRIDLVRLALSEHLCKLKPISQTIRIQVS